MTDATRCPSSKKTTSIYWTLNTYSSTSPRCSVSSTRSSRSDERRLSLSSCVCLPRLCLRSMPTLLRSLLVLPPPHLHDHLTSLLVSPLCIHTSSLDSPSLRSPVPTPRRSPPVSVSILPPGLALLSHTLFMIPLFLHTRVGPRAPGLYENHPSVFHFLRLFLSSVLFEFPPACPPLNCLVIIISGIGSPLSSQPPSTRAPHRICISGISHVCTPPGLIVLFVELRLRMPGPSRVRTRKMSFQPEWLTSSPWLVSYHSRVHT